MMNYRLAIQGDAKRLAYLHRLSSEKQPGGFMYQLGSPWLEQYYRILLGQRYTVIMCAEDDHGKIIGFASGSLDAAEGIAALRRNRLKLLWAALPAILRNPNLVKEVRSRQNSDSADQPSQGYVLQAGAHEDYWAWENPKQPGAIELHLKWLSLMRLLGVKSVKGEVDIVNDMILKTHQRLGAKIIGTFITPNGNERVIIEYVLDR
jgi:hypothetical protein